MSTTNDPIRIGNTWYFANGRTLPVVSGGSDAPAPQPDPTTLVVPAEPPKVDKTPTTAPDGQQLFTAEQVAAIRREEKDKLYGELTEIKTQNQQFKSKFDEWEQERQQRLAEEQRLEAEAAEARRLAEQAEMDAKTLLQTKEQEWDGKFRTLQEELQRDRVLQEQERQFLQTQAYLERRRAEETENIAPQLLPLVQGNTPEEIEASIASLRQASEAILADIAASAPQNQGRFNPPPAPGHVTAPVPYSDTHSDSQQFTLDQLQNMDPATYAANRHRLLPAANPRRQPRSY